MVTPFAYDVEILRNFFSIAIVDVQDYRKKFADCVNNKGKPIPLVEKLSVKEIISRLNEVKKEGFYITDTDSSNLPLMLKWFGDHKRTADVRTDMFGYNSMSYDKLMISAFLMWARNCNTTKELINKLYELSKRIISLQDNKEMLRNDYLLKVVRKNKLPYTDIDLFRIFALNKVSTSVDDKGNKVYMSKGLKQTSINLKWFELLEYELPPISDKDIHFYHNIDEYRGIPAETLNKLIEKWDRFIIDEWIEPTMHYNFNDVYIVCEMIRLFTNEISLRYTLSKVYNIDLLNSSRSNISDRLFDKYYSEFSGEDKSEWGGQITNRTIMAFNKVIFSFINFKTEPLQELLKEMLSVKVYGIGKNALVNYYDKCENNKYLKCTGGGSKRTAFFEITINKLTYTIATGGLHSKDIPRKLISKAISKEEGLPILTEKGKLIWENLTDDSYIFSHYDITSFYPSLMYIYCIAPAHLRKEIFANLIGWMRDTRVKAKHSTEPLVNGIPKDAMAEALKIVINAIYGKLGFENGDICDKLAVLKVTINGQLMVMMLCEALEMNGIEVMSANTDGIVVKLYKKDKEKFDKIANDWLASTKLGADSEEYKYYINRDINNYFIEEWNGKTDSKGALNERMFIKSLDKGYNMPIISKAVINYFVKNKPVMETLYEATDILDFCKTQNIGSQFHVELDINKQTIISQRQTRFYVSNEGGSIYKVHNRTGDRFGLAAGEKVIILNTLDDKSIIYRNIDYSYYYKEAYKIIDPIELQISPNQKGDKNNKTLSGKALINKYSGQYNSLFDDEDF